MPAPFEPLTRRGSLATELAAAQIPPIEALSPVSGLRFGDGLQVGPLLALLDGLGVLALVHFARRRWLADPD